MSGFIFSKWQGEKTRIPGTTVHLTQGEVKQVVEALLPELPRDVKYEAQEAMRTGKTEVSDRTAAVFGFAIMVYVQTHFAQKR